LILGDNQEGTRLFTASSEEPGFRCLARWLLPAVSGHRHGGLVCLTRCEINNPPAPLLVPLTAHMAYPTVGANPVSCQTADETTTTKLSALFTTKTDGKPRCVSRRALNDPLHGQESIHAREKTKSSGTTVLTVE